MVEFEGQAAIDGHQGRHVRWGYLLVLSAIMRPTDRRRPHHNFTINEDALHYTAAAQQALAARYLLEHQQPR